MAGLPRIHACMHACMHPPASPSLHAIAHWNLACESRHKWQHPHAAADAPTHRRDRRAAAQMQDAGAQNQRACVELVQLRVGQWRRLVRQRLQNPVFRSKHIMSFALRELRAPHVAFPSAIADRVVRHGNCCSRLCRCGLRCRCKSAHGSPLEGVPCLVAVPRKIASCWSMTKAVCLCHGAHHHGAKPS